MSKMTPLHKAVAYICNKELGIRQQDVARMMCVSQSTVANAVKEFGYRKDLQNAGHEYQLAREYVRENQKRLGQYGLCPYKSIFNFDN